MFSVLLLILAAATDIRTGKIRNRLILSGLAAGLFFQLAEAGWISFLAASAMSLGKMLYHRNLVSRLCIFGDYIRQTFAAAQFCQYPKSQGNQHIIHFSIAIFIGYIIAMEVAC